MRFFHIVKQTRNPVEWSMNIQSKMKTRDAKNTPVTAVLVSVLVMFLLSCLFLLLLAALLYKFDLSESAVKVGIVVIYIVSGVIGGFFMGKIMKTQKFLWGFAAGALYFCILFLISVLVKQGVSMELPKVATTFILCAASGMAGGMIS